MRLRPPAIDLWTSHTASAAEVALLFLLLGAVYLHHLPQVGSAWPLPNPNPYPYPILKPYPSTCTTCRRLGLPGLCGLILGAVWA